PHGYSADQAIMSSIARSLTRASYAVLTFDFRGHGANTHPFRGDLNADLDAALDWADRSPYVDRNRTVLLGHSMGASAVLEFASRDPRPKAVVPLSGGDVVDDVRVPQNVLLMAAAHGICPGQGVAPPRRRPRADHAPTRRRPTLDPSAHRGRRRRQSGPGGRRPLGRPVVRRARHGPGGLGGHRALAAASVRAPT